MYCPKCGKENDNNSRFCRYCNYELPNIETVEKDSIISNDDSENNDNDDMPSNSSSDSISKEKPSFFKNKVAVIGTLAGAFITITTVIINFSQIKDIFSPAPEPQKIEFEESAIFMNEGASMIPIIKTTPENADTKNLLWEIEDPNIAEYTNGKLIAKNSGKTVLSVYYNDSVYTVTDVVVGSKTADDNSLLKSMSYSVEEDYDKLKIHFFPHFIDDYPGTFKGYLHIEILSMKQENEFTETIEAEISSTGTTFEIDYEDLTPGNVDYGIVFYRLFDGVNYDSDVQEERLYYLPTIQNSDKTDEENIAEYKEFLESAFSGFDGFNIEQKDHVIVVNAWLDLYSKKAHDLISGEDDDWDYWERHKETNESIAKNNYDYLKRMGLDDYHLSYNIVDNTNNNSILLSYIDGALIDDAVTKHRDSKEVN